MLNCCRCEAEALLGAVAASAVGGSVGGPKEGLTLREQIENDGAGG